MSNKLNAEHARWARTPEDIERARERRIEHQMRQCIAREVRRMKRTADPVKRREIVLYILGMKAQYEQPRCEEPPQS